MEVVERVREILREYLDAHAIELVEMTYRRESQGLVLRLLVDTQAGIKVSECEALNHFLSEKLDAEDLIGERYILEVSSPGLGRPLKTNLDFRRVVGRVIEVDISESVDGKRHIEGALTGMASDAIVVESRGISTVIPKSKIALARLKVEF
jgi:ribosome maturation factor RimP